MKSTHPRFAKAAQLRFLKRATWCILSLNIGVLIASLVARRWALACVQAALACHGFYMLQTMRRQERIKRYMVVLIDRCRQVTTDHIDTETIEECRARVLAMSQTLARAYKSIWRKPWGPVEPYARDLELFGVPIAEHLPEDQLERRIP